MTGKHFQWRRVHPRLLRPMTTLSCLAAMLGACGGSQKPDSDSSTEVQFVVSSEDTSNDGRPFRMLVRAVTLEDYLQETYASVADKVMNPDESVLSATVIFPGEEKRVSVTRPEEASIGVYFLFSQPGDPWRLRISRTDLTHVTLYLGADRILEPTVEPALGE